MRDSAHMVIHLSGDGSNLSVTVALSDDHVLNRSFFYFAQVNLHDAFPFAIANTLYYFFKQLLRCYFFLHSDLVD